MSEETSGEEGDDESLRKLRGTASRPNPFAEGSPPEEAEADATIVINAPDSSIREYRLTETVRGMYETLVEQRIGDACSWYDMWWSGTELIIEYEGHIRDDSLRPKTEDLSQQELQKMFQEGEQPEVDGIPKRQNQQRQDPRKAMMQGQMPEPTISVDLAKHSDPNPLNELDEGILPVWNKTTIDVQERANERPLIVEDLFIRPWENGEDTGQEPINSKHPDGELDEDMFQVDFRDYTDSEDNTVANGARGDRWNM